MYMCLEYCYYDTLRIYNNFIYVSHLNTLICKC